MRKGAPGAPHLLAAIGLAWFWLAVGCQTGGPLPDGEVPADLAPVFRSCAPADGGVAVTVRDSAAVLGSAELDWVAKDAETFEAQLSGPIGQTLLTLRRQASALSVEGPLAAKMPRLRLLKSGFIEVDGHFVGLRANELGCLLRAALPAAWVPRLAASDMGANEVKLRFAETKRDMTATFNRGKDGFSAYCADVSWRTFLFFGQTVTWCVQDLDVGRKGSVSGLGDYTLEWTRIDES